jgi:hypothetical protein
MPRKQTYIHLDFPLKNEIQHLDDMKEANDKVEEVERLIAEQEWKLRPSNMDYHLSFVLYGNGHYDRNLFHSVLLLLRCLKRFPNFPRWWNENNPFTIIF